MFFKTNTDVNTQQIFVFWNLKMFYFTLIHVEIKSVSGNALVTNWRSVSDETVQIKHDNDWHGSLWLRKVIKNSRSLCLSNVLIQWWSFSYMMQKIPPDRKLTFGLPFNSSIYNSAAGKRAMWAAWAPLLRSKVFLYFLHTNLNKQCLIRACFGKGYSWDALAIIFIQFNLSLLFFILWCRATVFLFVRSLTFLFIAAKISQALKQRARARDSIP